MAHPETTRIEHTADALSVVRSDTERVERFGVRDPYALSFVTPEGREVAEAARHIDPLYDDYNLARYRHFAEAMQAAAGSFSQLLVLGSGLDTRALWLAGVAESPWRMFEVEQPAKLQHKHQVLDRLKVDRARLASIPANLGEEELPSRLQEAGFDVRQATFVVLEGVSFFLPSRIQESLFRPAWLGLAAGSVLAFDYWTDARVEELADRVHAEGGESVFQRSVLGPDIRQMEAGLSQRGFDAEVVSLESFARGVGGSEVPTDPLRGWQLVTAVVR